ncbi:MAG: ribonuclease P protein component [Bacteroidales bacterium]
MQTFKKGERLHKKREIERLFKSGHSFTLYPFRVMWLDTPPVHNAPPAHVLVAVSKRYDKRATGRNKIKRRIKEAYRKNKHVFYDFLTGCKHHCNLCLVYISRESHDYADIEKKIIQVLERLISEHKKNQ